MIDCLVPVAPGQLPGNPASPLNPRKPLLPRFPFRPGSPAVQ